MTKPIRTFHAIGLFRVLSRGVAATSSRLFGVRLDDPGTGGKGRAGATVSGPTALAFWDGVLGDGDAIGAGTTGFV